MRTLPGLTAFAGRASVACSGHFRRLGGSGFIPQPACELPDYFAGVDVAGPMPTICRIVSSSLAPS
jgi:hypothetical protein